MKEIQKFVQYKLSNIIQISKKKVAHETTTFFISHGKLFKAAYGVTISRCVKEVMAEAGIDVSKYNARSCRSAALIGALYKGLHIEDILKQGNWSNLKTF